ncbi:imm11 family protein [Myxococcus qinghaiensis]|uniref:imm11 family protein n=1 Tax=Myxococcus qinghaiensis TaxID=2906758 RepID=UPI0020A81889|nr:DUF1629 domain-containing protein [Myxococcus qinghaiensis]MCP3165755.1 hypothetical protein [Myxococcus qinghaiensis]
MQTEYFVLEAAANDSHPLLQWDESGSAFHRGEAVSVTEPIRLRLGQPVPRHPVMVDHHTLPEPVISERIRNVLEPLSLHRVQFVPADVRVSTGDVRRYWLMHVFNELACIDARRSLCRRSPSGLVMVSLDKLVLDEQMLRAVPEELRRVFVLTESVSTYLFHVSMVEKVLALQPEGFRFVPVNQWNDATGFEP